MSSREDFARLFLKLDGGIDGHRREATEGCVEALFDRVMSPPMLDLEQPTLEDVDAAERQLIDMIKVEAEKARDMIRRTNDPQDPVPA